MRGALNRGINRNTTTAGSNSTNAPKIEGRTDTEPSSPGAIEAQITQPNRNKMVISQNEMATGKRLTLDPDR